MKTPNTGFLAMRLFIYNSETANFVKHILLLAVIFCCEDSYLLQVLY